MFQHSIIKRFLQSNIINYICNINKNSQKIVVIKLIFQLYGFLRSAKVGKSKNMLFNVFCEGYNAREAYESQ